MWFYKYKTVLEPATMLAKGPTEREVELRLGTLAIVLLFALGLIALAIYAYKVGWSDGAKQILSVFVSFFGGTGIGVFIGERNATTK